MDEQEQRRRAVIKETMRQANREAWERIQAKADALWARSMMLYRMHRAEPCMCCDDEVDDG